MPLENYILGKVIGKGSYGEVSLAKHKKDKKQVEKPICFIIRAEKFSVVQSINPVCRLWNLHAREKQQSNREEQ